MSAAENTALDAGRVVIARTQRSVVYHRPAEGNALASACALTVYDGQAIPREHAVEAGYRACTFCFGGERR